jgi:hypothetical protein
VRLLSINVWRLAGDTLNITCNFLYCNHQVNRDFLITLYIYIYKVKFSDEKRNGAGGNFNVVKPNERVVKCSWVKFKWEEVKCQV